MGKQEGIIAQFTSNIRQIWLKILLFPLKQSKTCDFRENGAQWESYKNFSINEAKNNDTSSIITKDEKYNNDPVSIANTFNNFFTSVAEIVH